MKLYRVNETPSKAQNRDWYTGAAWSKELVVGELTDDYIPARRTTVLR